MLKREIIYEDFNGDSCTDIFYFNLSKPELLSLEVEYGQGFGKMLENIIETKDNKALVKQFQSIILMAYGQKSEDGKRFIKTEKLRDEFSQSAAYEVLFMEIASDEKIAAQFMNGIIPKDMIIDQDKPNTELKLTKPDEGE